MSNTVKTRLEAMLKSSKMTAYELSKASGVQYTTIDRILSGKTERPSQSTLAMLSKALEADPKDFGVHAKTDDQSLLNRALSKLEEQIERKDRMIEGLMRKVLSDPNFRLALNGTGLRKRRSLGAAA